MILATVSQSEPSINVNYEVLAGDTSTVQYSTVQYSVTAVQRETSQQRSLHWKLNRGWDEYSLGWRGVECRHQGPDGDWSLTGCILT